MSATATLERWDGFFTEAQALGLRAGEPEWMLTGRDGAAEQFRQRGLPQRGEEAWKYTDVSDVGTSVWRLPRPDWKIDQRSLPVMRRGDEVQLLFVDGLYIPEQSSIQDLAGVEVHVLDGHGCVGDVEAFRASGAAGRPGDASAFTLLNQALNSSVVVLRVAPGVSIDQRIHFLFLTTGLIPNVLVSPRIHVQAGRGCRVRVVQSHIGSPAAMAMTNAVTDMDLAPEAVVFYAKVQSEGVDALHFSRLRTTQAAGSRLTALDFSVGGRLSRNEVYARLDGAGAAFECNGIYAVKGRQHVDNHTTIEHAQPQATSRQLYKGILDGKARAVFNGCIVVRPGATQSDAFQLNRNLLLSRGAQVDTKPQLEIANDDVRCTHGATIGRMDAEELFYLQSRCIDPAAARAMLSRGFAEEVLFGIEDVPLRDSLRDVLGSFFEPEGKV